jgi:type II secretory pathway component PulF
MTNVSTESAPAAPVAGLRGPLLLGAHWAAAFAFTVQAIGLHLMIAAFSKTLASFGSDLPGLTRHVYASRAAIDIFPVLPWATALLLTWSRHWREQAWRPFALALVFYAVMFFATIILVFLATYLPIFQLGSVV